MAVEVALPTELKIPCELAIIAELLSQIGLIPVSLLTVYIVYKSALVHANLKLLLMFECLVSIMQAVARLCAIGRIIGRDSMESNPPPLINFIDSTGIVANNWLTLLYNTERILATVYVKTYERQRPFFGALCTLATFSVAVYVSYTESFQPIGGPVVKNRSTVYIMTFFYDVMGFLSVALMFGLERYNLRRYQEASKYGRNPNLTERYQSSENVRTARQLLPVVALHATANVVTTVFVTSNLFWPQTESQRLLPRMGLHLAHSAIYLLSKIAVLYCHPILRRAVRELYYDVRHRMGRSIAGNRVAPQRSPESLNGSPLIMGQEQEARLHFAGLGEMWDQQYTQRKIK